MNHRAVYIAARTDQGTWNPVGRLSRTQNDVYEFVYLKGAEQAGSSGYLPGMNDHNIVYRSKKLFPFFKNRLLSEKRSEYSKFLEWTNLAGSEASPEPLAILEVTEGKKSTDNYEVFPCPVQLGNDDEGYYYEFKFFLHGVRHLAECSRRAILDLSFEDSLRALHDWQNPYNKDAFLLCNMDSVTLGYLPNYLTEEVARLRKDCAPETIKFSVEKVNPDAPAGFLLLCVLRACWNDNARPFSDENFRPVPSNVAQSCEVLALAS